MALNDDEKLVLEAFNSLLNQDAELGLSIHDYKDESIERGFEYLHNHIDDLFKVKSAELTHTDGINSAFSKVHTYKYIDDPKFATAMQKEMVAQGVPANERAKAVEFLDTIIDQLKDEQQEWAEKDSGFNPNLDEIMSMPESEDEFTIEDSDLNEGNVDFEEGEAGPARTP
jgi:polyhydroxyalkanoate synthesis regulator phasin